jgi:hypothetical protein
MFLKIDKEQNVFVVLIKLHKVLAVVTWVRAYRVPNFDS